MYSNSLCAVAFRVSSRTRCDPQLHYEPYISQITLYAFYYKWSVQLNSFFSPAERPDFLLGWFIQLPSVYLGLFLMIRKAQCVKLTTHLSLVPSFRMCGATPPLFHIPLHSTQGQILFSFNVTY